MPKFKDDMMELTALYIVEVVMRFIVWVFINVGVFFLSCAKQLSEDEGESWEEWLNRVKITGL